jgi:hypothetical protein
LLNATCEPAVGFDGSPNQRGDLGFVGHVGLTKIPSAPAFSAAQRFAAFLRGGRTRPAPSRRKAMAVARPMPLVPPSLGRPYFQISRLINASWLVDFDFLESVKPGGEHQFRNMAFLIATPRPWAHFIQ